MRPGWFQPAPFAILRRIHLRHHARGLSPRCYICSPVPFSLANTDRRCDTTPAAAPSTTARRTAEIAAAISSIMELVSPPIYLTSSMCRVCPLIGFDSLNLYLQAITYLLHQLQRSPCEERHLPKCHTECQRYHPHGDRARLAYRRTFREGSARRSVTSSILSATPSDVTRSCSVGVGESVDTRRLGLR